MKIRSILLAALVLLFMDVCFLHNYPPTLGISPPPPATVTPLPTLEHSQTPIPWNGETWLRPKDDMIMVFIPSGQFSMGMDLERSMSICGRTCSPESFMDEQPVHPINLGDYWIDRTEVTNAQYNLCVQAAVCLPPQQFAVVSPVDYFYDGRHADYPVIYVSWFDAETYCNWVDSRLPTEAEWEKAARGTDGRAFPWGEELPTPNLAAYYGTIEDVITAVGLYPAGASPYNALDMAGNVWEWVADWYSEDYYTHTPMDDPSGPTGGTEKVMRGGSAIDLPYLLRTAERNFIDPDAAEPVIGFRCARDGISQSE